MTPLGQPLAVSFGALAAQRPAAPADPAPIAPSQPPTWRSTAVGALVIALVAVRVYFDHSAIFAPETIGFFGLGCSLILGTDKLLGR